jgi:hypothetical protein
MAIRKVKAWGRVRDGKLTIDFRPYFDSQIKDLGDCDISIEITAESSSRSNVMNRYYWGVVIATLVRHFNSEWTFGEKVDKDYVHSIFASKFLSTGENILADGEIVKKVSSTTSLNNKEFIEYWEAIIAWAATYLDLQIPYPSEDFSCN